MLTVSSFSGPRRTTLSLQTSANGEKEQEDQFPFQEGTEKSMFHPAVTIQISPESAPSTPAWFGEVAAFAQLLTQTGILTAITERVRFARARLGTYELIDFVVVLIGYALSGEPTLQAFYDRLLPLSDVFMALFDRSHLPSRSALSRFLAALDQASVQTLRTLF